MDRDSPPSRVFDYPEGPTFAYLIDLLDPTEQRVEYRAYYQDAPSDGSIGLIPDDVAGRPVDVALLCAGTFDVVHEPESIVKNFRTRHVVLGHWENFFVDQTWPVLPIPFLPLHEYGAALRHELDSLGSMCRVHRPNPQEVMSYDSAGVLDHGGRRCPSTPP